MIINNEIANISDPYTFWCDKNLNNKKLITSIIIAYLLEQNTIMTAIIIIPAVRMISITLYNIETQIRLKIIKL